MSTDHSYFPGEMMVSTDVTPLTLTTWTMWLTIAVVGGWISQVEDPACWVSEKEINHDTSATGIQCSTGQGDLQDSCTQSSWMIEHQSYATYSFAHISVRWQIERLAFSASKQDKDNKCRFFCLLLAFSLLIRSSWHQWPEQSNGHQDHSFSLSACLDKQQTAYLFLNLSILIF